MGIEPTSVHNKVDTISIGPLQTAITATDVIAAFNMPYDGYFIGASMAAGTIDAANADETYVLTITEGATTICTLTFPRATAADTPVVGTPTAAQQMVAKDSTIKATLTLGGTSPSITLAYIILSFVRA